MLKFEKGKSDTPRGRRPRTRNSPPTKTGKRIAAANPQITPAQDEFCRAYIEREGSLTAAYRAAFPGCTKSRDSTVRSEASRLYASPHIKARIQELREKIVDEFVIEQKDILMNLYRIARFDIGTLFDEKGNLLPVHEWSEDARRTVLLLESEEVPGRNATVRKLKLPNRLEAYDKLMRHLGMFDKDNSQKVDKFIINVHPRAEQQSR